ncbi:MAG: DNA methyltransferase [Chloroflexota bacterium]|nr:DNA methyltransferase [Chloroflexota bacterium]
MTEIGRRRGSLPLNSTTENISQKLAHLLDQDLSFTGGEKPHPLHSIHAFAAKFPAQLPRHFIEGLSDPGETVLDPMAGSGSTLLEGWLLGRDVIGVDLDPLAEKQCRAKTAWVDPQVAEEAGQRALANARRRVEVDRPLDTLRRELDDATTAFLDYWFLPETQVELAALALEIREETAPALRNLLEVLFSATIVTKSGGVSRARDLAHSRPHRVADKQPRSPFRMFEAQVRHAVRAFEETPDMSSHSREFLAGDSRHLPLADNSVDLIVTSPPYANALDYMRAHKFSLVWLGHRVGGLGNLRGKYIGAERQSSQEAASLPDDAQRAIASLSEIDRQKSRVLARYLGEMRQAIEEMHRVIRPGRAVVIVVGPSTMRGQRIATQDYLAGIAEQAGFGVVGVEERNLDRDRRMMPARWGNGGHKDGRINKGIELRLHEEFIIGLAKD